MYVDDCTYKRGSKTYRRVLIRDSYREQGTVKHNTIAKITQASDEEIEAIKIALKNKRNLLQLDKLAKGECYNGKIIAPVSVLYQLANRFGFLRIFNKCREGLLILWLIMARVIDHGSRLSAVRLASIHAGCESIGISSLNENMLYDAMDWLYVNKESIEKRLFNQWNKRETTQKRNNIFLYDVTSSYFEGDQNELAEFGYNRDKKNGKKQVVYGFLTDEFGEPLAIEAFKGNTKDNKTVSAQIETLKKRFGCEYVTFVGDKGMIKSEQITEFHKEENNIHYITSITKPQIQSLLSKKFFKIGLFDEKLCEIVDVESTIRYICRRNPYRAEEIKANRESKISLIKRRLEKSNIYLKEHKRALVSVQERELTKYIKKLKMEKILLLEEVEGNRELKLKRDKAALAEKSKLDGCYVIKTDLPLDVACKEIIHDRYKALSEIEWAFRVSKDFLRARPIYVKKKERTIAHLFIVMLAYRMERYLRNAWWELELTVEEGIKTLGKISSYVIEIGEKKLLRVPKPDEDCKKLLEKINVKLPEILPYREVTVATRTKLKPRRKSR